MSTFKVNDTKIGLSALASAGLKPIWNASELYDTDIKPLTEDNIPSDSVLSWDSENKQWTVKSRIQPKFLLS